VKGDLHIERWPLERLIPYARNPRTHTEDQVAQIAASIAEFGFVNPALVGADGVIIAGHARVMAARKLGMAEAPVIVLDHLSEAQRRVLVIADNRLAQNAGWDEEMLRVELEALREDEFNLDLLVSGVRDPFTKSLDLAENEIGTCRPDEGFRCAIALVQVLVHGLFQLADAGVTTSTDATLGYFAEQAFDQIQPTATGRREVHVVTRVTSEPVPYAGDFVRPVVVHHQMHVDL